MNLTTEMSDAAQLQELGARLRRQRLNHNLSQAALALEAGISRSTIERLESGGSIQLTKLLRVLRALKLSGNLNLLAPSGEPTPMQRLHGRRERARTSSSSTAPWTWGEK